MSRLKFVSIQMTPFPLDIKKNLEKAEGIISSIGSGFNVLLLPELFSTGHVMESRIQGVIWENKKMLEEWFKKISLKYNCLVLGGSGREEEGVFFNSIYICSNGEEIDFYDKSHLFRKEKDYFTPGNDIKIVEYKGVKIGLFICYEIGFPELHRILSLEGATVLAGFFAFSEKRKIFYETLTKARVLENGSFMITSCLIGAGKDDLFYGHSRIMKPSGEIIKETIDSEGWISEEIDADESLRFRYEEHDDSNAYFKNIRLDMYKLSSVDLSQIKK